MTWIAWASAAERAEERLLALQPNWLMVVEGINSANDLSGVRDWPVKYNVPGRVVYSAHVYAWCGWSQMKPFN